MALFGAIGLYIGLTGFSYRVYGVYRVLYIGFRV